MAERGSQAKPFIVRRQRDFGLEAVVYWPVLVEADGIRGGIRRVEARRAITIFCVTRGRSTCKKKYMHVVTGARETSERA